VRGSVALGRGALRFRGWVPLALLVLLMLGIGAYVDGRSSAFLTQYNLNSLLLTALPLSFVAIGQASAMLVGGFDVSVGALMTMGVIVASYTMTDGLAWWVLLFGSLAVVGVGAVVGLGNAVLVRLIRLPSIIATLGTLSVLQGISLALRPIPAGSIGVDVQDAFNSSASFVPYGFVAVLVLAALLDFWLYRSASGLTARAVGLDDTSSRRLGAPAERVQWRAYVVASTMAGFGAFFLGAQLGVGDATPSTGTSYTLQSIAAAVLGGASLAGGKGSFVGAVFGAVFLSLIVNILPFVGWSDAYGQISIGGLTLAALVLYQGGAVWGQARAAWRVLRRPAVAAG